MNSFIGIITLAAAYATQILAFIFSIYAFFISSFGWFYNDSKRKFVPAKRFALLIPAHNEENVIECIIDSLYHSDYPKELYDIFVIADNCTDQTAMLSRNRGVTVYQRNHDTKIGKGYALEWAFNILLQSETPYDAAAIFDADNVVAPDFLKEMNNKLCEGHQVIQGYVDSKNPFDSWITCAYSICFWAATRLLQIPRHNLGLSCSLWGTGFVVDMNVLKEIGWNATCLTEDLEFSTKLVLNNYKVAWAQHATVYDEKPLSLLHSWHQRKRWMQGHADIRKR
ncbi:MAG: glycosyltransferase family 2 protein [Clostridia bacterium]